MFAVSIVTALTVCSFWIKKCAKMSVLYVKIVKICWRLGATPPDPLGLQRLGVSPPGPRWCPLPPLCPILGCAAGDDLCCFPFPTQCGPRLQNFFQCGPSCRKFAHSWVKQYTLSLTECGVLDSHLKQYQKQYQTKSALQHDCIIHLTSQILSTSLAWYAIAAAAQWHFLCMACHVPCQRVTENS